MYLELITPDKSVFEGEISGVKVPGINGSFELLDKHADIISALEKGEVRITSAEGKQSITITGGTLEMNNNKVVILAEAIQSA